MLYFHNPGELDIRGATIAGLSAKEGDSPIGMFGTGLKYAIACVLRWKGRITIYSGETEYRFEAEPLTFRGADFEQVVLHFPSGPLPLGFTTAYGKQWKPWQVFRELYANALDEGGQVGIAPPGLRSGTTVIEVDCPQLDAIYPARDEIILPALDYCYRTADILLANRLASSIYYRGVRVADKNCLLTYNIQRDCKLTEDRTLADSWEAMRVIRESVMLLEDEELILRVVSTKGTYEANLDYPDWVDCSEQFLAVAERLFRQDPVKWAKFRDLLAAKRPAVLTPPLIELTPFRQKMLDRASALCERMGLHPADHQIRVADLGNSTLGKYERATGHIYLSPICFDRGTKQVLSALYEELIHAETGKADCNYDMQTFLFDKIISLYEEFVFQEPI